MSGREAQFSARHQLVPLPDAQDLTAVQRQEYSSTARAVAHTRFSNPGFLSFSRYTSDDSELLGWRQKPGVEAQPNRKSP